MYNFSDRLLTLEGNAIREIFKALEQPDVISFAGGLPAPECLPAADVARVTAKVLAEKPAEILQYGATEGYKPLIESVAKFAERKGIFPSPSQILIVSGGQQGIDLTFKAFINKGDVVLVENPTYLAAMHILKTYEGVAVGVESDDDGLNIGDLEKKMIEYKPKILYLVPDFSNPTGKTLSLQKRSKVVELAREHSVIVLEDDPYGELRFDGTRVQSIKSLDASGQVVYVSSFSKIIAPGLRVGFVIADDAVIKKMAIGKQAADVLTCQLSQAIVDAYLREGLLQPHLQNILPIYKRKKDTMKNALKKYMPSTISFTNPDGGLFLFGEFENKEIDTAAIFEDAVSKSKCAYVPGAPFFAQGGHGNTFRLNFSAASERDIDKGISRLANYFKHIL